MDPFIGRYYSMEWVRKNVLQQTDEEIDEIMKQIEKEKADGTFIDPNAMQDPNNPMNQPQIPDSFGGGGQPQQQQNGLGQQNNADQDYSRFAPPMTQIGSK
jgi:hypothetical protein